VLVTCFKYGDVAAAACAPSRANVLTLEVAFRAKLAPQLRSDPEGCLGGNAGL
jgi:hypothetical protein